MTELRYVLPLVCSSQSIASPTMRAIADIQERYVCVRATQLIQLAVVNTSLNLV